jgi:hypothetical protein
VPARGARAAASRSRRAGASAAAAGRAQHALDRIYWTQALGGCRTTRDTETAIRDAGFDVVEIERGFHASSLLTITSEPYVVGRAYGG